jgi:hypothetical protein
MLQPMPRPTNEGSLRDPDTGHKRYHLLIRKQHSLFKCIAVKLVAEKNGRFSIHIEYKSSKIRLNVTETRQ